MAQCAGYARFVYNYGLNMVNGIKGMTKVSKRGLVLLACARTLSKRLRRI